MLRAMPATWSIEREGVVAVATFTRPPRNFMSFAAMGELEQLLRSLAEDGSASPAKRNFSCEAGFDGDWCGDTVDEGIGA